MPSAFSNEISHRAAAHAGMVEQPLGVANESVPDFGCMLARAAILLRLSGSDGGEGVPLHVLCRMH
jgi:hypothetical protein